MAQVPAGAAIIPKGGRECVVVGRTIRRGSRGIDVRVWVLGEDGQPSFPTKKGLTLREVTWRELLPAIQVMLQEDDSII